MKRMCSFFSLILSFFLLPAIAFSQCSGSCPTGALTTLPASGIIAAGTTYCISGTVSNTTSYTISGTLIVQSGTVSIGTVTLNKTGAILVNSAAKLSTGSFTGESTAPASTIANITVCSGGYLAITGSFNQWETNIVLNNYAVFVMTGSWTSSSTDIYADIGMGALVEMCGSLNINSNGFFTETTTSPSYLITEGGVSESIINGWLSTKQSASLIKWTSLAASAFVSHPAAYTCNACGNNSLAPPGITPEPSSCTADANSYIISILPAGILDFRAQTSGQSVQLIAELDASLPVQQVVLESSADGRQFITSPYTATLSTAGGNTLNTADANPLNTAGNNLSGTGTGQVNDVFTVPVQPAAVYYRVRVVSASSTFYSQVLALPGQTVTGPGWTIFPDPFTQYIYLQLPSNSSYTAVSVVSSAGQLILQKNLPVPTPAGPLRIDLPPSLSAGIYFIKITGPGETPLLQKALKN